MLIGHYAPALVLKVWRPQTPLWALCLAAQAVDILWCVLVLSGVERAQLVAGHTASNDLVLEFMPYSHSLVAAGVWGVLLALLAARVLPVGAALPVGLGVASHWLMDLPVHAQDLPLAAGDGIKLGFGLWHWRWPAFALELGLFVGASWWLRRSLPKPQGRFDTWLLMLALLCAYSYFAPSPPTIVQLSLSTLTLYLVVPAAAWWAERRIWAQQAV